MTDAIVLQARFFVWSYNRGRWVVKQISEERGRGERIEPPTPGPEPESTPYRNLWILVVSE